MKFKFIILGIVLFLVFLGVILSSLNYETLTNSFSQTPHRLYTYFTNDVKDLQLEKFTINLTDCEYKIIDYYNTSDPVCTENITHPNNNTVTCISWWWREITVPNIKCIPDGIVRVNNIYNITYPDRFCISVSNNRVDCVKHNDGYSKDFKGCQKQGGMNCKVHILDDFGNYNVSTINSEIFIKGITKSIREVKIK